ncbi:YheE family protein [Desertibacillus haloalkaliphilus]|uniref:YheE family protein n=1 Tax=Desertibacillus haloalkaliphilus TaxID=1328930 RepID=UPI001C25AF72|nr:YheE family protein [Desertibacillus haloalkaliphilus]MBU8905424.1 YheE family protein [Desertibacillus haloalkaliphilus]
MISHFQWKEIRNNLVRREWEFSFFYAGTYFQGRYHKDGTIEWPTASPNADVIKTIEMQIHDLMLYHVYEDH